MPARAEKGGKSQPFRFSATSAGLVANHPRSWRLIEINDGPHAS